MLTKLTVENFKGLDCTLELDHSVVFVGPNNSGKTTALQALSLWETGLHAWMSKRSEGSKAKKRVGVTINRRDMISIPVADARFLWNKQRVRVGSTNKGKNQKTENILMTITVEGVLDDKPWTFGLEFDYANSETFYCRPTANEDNILRMSSDENREMLDGIRMAFLPPMSGLASVERKLEQGSVDVLIGEGQTAQILRNLCLQLFQRPPDTIQLWDKLDQGIQTLFGIKLFPPEYDSARGEISMYYQDQGETGGTNKLELASAGRGLQQTLLILTFLYLHPGAIILLDEPDAHLEILRQKQIYEEIKAVAHDRGGQVVIATHSEVLLNESAEKDTVIAFLGVPHRLNDKGQLIKSLSEYGWDQYLLAKQKGWVLYLEGSTDLDILRAFARLLDHPVENMLANVFFHPLGNNVPAAAKKHFYALREAKADLLGYALYDRIPEERIKSPDGLQEHSLKRREIENYFCTEEVLVRWARGKIDTRDAESLFASAAREEQGFRERQMREAVAKVEQSMKTLK
ncbi:MAG TPA: AAA family ATPase, partial [Planctomycetaceae bacterium]|nr:AAA family ATPase [Planctomycetaceae bacterium]